MAGMMIVAWFACVVSMLAGPSQAGASDDCLAGTSEACAGEHSIEILHQGDFNANIELASVQHVSLLQTRRQYRGPHYSVRAKQDAQAAIAWLGNHNESLIQEFNKSGYIVAGYLTLTYTHIPKTAGDSFVLATSPLNPYGMGVLMNSKLWGLLAMEDFDFSNIGRDYEQLPPKEAVRRYPMTAEYWSHDVFCSVRQPYEKLVSAFKMECAYTPLEFLEFPCTAEGLEAFVFDRAEQMRTDPWADDGFLLPQTEYLRKDVLELLRAEGSSAYVGYPAGGSPPNNCTPTAPENCGCNVVLDFAHLEDDWEELMAKSGYNLTLPPASATHPGGKGYECNVTVADLGHDALAVLNQVYADDFAVLGAKFGWQMRE
mmetsp:Transcript_41094/g.114225  ORF Transcript_41094/g.114225 Transcript_41094/m.114225 type:complete len:372 (-) Transcript_41094:62-1177(-)